MMGLFFAKYSNYMYTQGLRLTFQLATPVASDRFDSLAKATFSLARRRHLLLCHEKKILPDL